MKTKENIRKQIKSEKGITLLALGITVIVIIILASVAITSGKGAIETARLNAFQAQMQLVQQKVNDICQRGEQDTYKAKGKAITEATSTKALDTLEANGVTIDRNELVYYTSEDIESTLDLDGVDQNVFIDFTTRQVISENGVKADGVIYYRIEDIPDGMRNIEYQNPNTGNITFEISEEMKPTQTILTIKNITFPEDTQISNYTIKYQEEGSTTWKTATNDQITITKSGTYKIKIETPSTDLYSNEETIKVTVLDRDGKLDPNSVETGGTDFEMTTGTTDVVFLKGTGYTIGEANAPILDDNMIPIKYNSTSKKWVITTDTDPDWYNYDTTNKVWANVMLTDGTYTKETAVKDTQVEESELGSMYVWIPRYAYKISYFANSDDKTSYLADRTDKSKIIGYSDARGIIQVTNGEEKAVEVSTSISVDNGTDKYYRPHPVFEGDVTNGGWDKKVTGMWVAKFEMTTTTSSTKNNLMVLPNKTSQRDINVSTMFSKAKEIQTNVGLTKYDSHMMKNSEWGAVAYLTESVYGRNGIEVSVNQCSSHVTGAGRGLKASEDETGTATGTSDIYNSTYSSSNITDKQRYNGSIGVLSSTTGNVYGIYDMSGEAYEYVMGFYKDTSGIHTGYDKLNCSGFNGYFSGGTEYTSGTELPEAKYYNTYENPSNSYTDASGGMYGDATKEVKSWNSDYPLFVYFFNPVFNRGGNYGSEAKAGVFCFNNKSGSGYSNSGFRSVLIDV